MKPTREQILNEPAGRAMDTWITRYVFEETKSIRDYSSNIYYAWWVVERLKDLGYKVMVLTTGDIIGDLWQFSVADFYRQITFYDDKGGYANAETPSLAICRAALLAVLKDIENDRDSIPPSVPA